MSSLLGLRPTAIGQQMTFTNAILQALNQALTPLLGARSSAGRWFKNTVSPSIGLCYATLRHVSSALDPDHASKVSEY